MLSSLFGSSKKQEASLASATSRASAWREQCNRLDHEKRELEHRLINLSADLDELRKQNAYMSNALSEQHRLKEVLANSDKISLEELRLALSNAEKSDPLLRSVFYLINRRQESCEIKDADEELNNGLRLAFNNGSVHALRKIKEDLLALIAQAGEDKKYLKHTRSPFSMRRCDDGTSNSSEKIS